MCSKARSHVHYDRSIVNSFVNKTTLNQEFYADKNTYLQWYHNYQTVNKFTDGRSYAHVVSGSRPLHVKRDSAGYTARHVHSDPRCQSLPQGSKGKEKNFCTFHSSCKKSTYVPRKSSFSGTKVTTLGDQDVGNTLPLANRFQVFNEMEVDTPHINANAESPTPCHTVANSPQISDSVILRQDIKDSSSDSLNQPLTSQFALADGDIDVYDIGFSLTEGNRGTEVEGMTSQMVTNHELLHRTQHGAFTKDCSDNDLARQLQTNNKKPMDDTRMLELDLHHLELDLTTDLVPDTHFSKSFMANKDVPQVIRQQCYNSKDFQLSKIQNGHDFGFIPLTDIKTYQGPPVTWPHHIDILEAHEIIRSSGVPIFLKCRIPVQTQLKPKVWAQKLKNYWDQQLPDLIAFGFPLDFDRSKMLTSSFGNHTSAKQHGVHIDRYIQEELEYKALYGLYQSVPFEVHVSPLMTREK